MASLEMDDKFSKAMAYLAKHRFYWLYVPLFWIVIALAAIVLLKGHAIVPFIYRTI